MTPLRNVVNAIHVTSRQIQQNETVSISETVRYIYENYYFSILHHVEHEQLAVSCNIK